MNVKQKIAVGIGGVTVAAAAALGVGYVATNATASSQSSQQDASGGRGARPSGAGQGLDTDALVTALATGLDKDEAVVKTAVESAISSAMPDNAGGHPSAPPSGSQDQSSGTPTTDVRSGGGRATKLAAAIATALDADEATVLKIVQETLSTAAGTSRAVPSAAPTG